MYSFNVDNFLGFEINFRMVKGPTNTDLILTCLCRAAVIRQIMKL